MQNCVFLCILDNFLLKNVIFFLKIKFQNDAHLRKIKAIFDLLFTFFKSLQRKGTKFFFGATPGVDSYSCHFGAINK